MIENSKQKIGELGAAGINIAKAPLGIAAGAMATPLAAAYDTATNAVKAIPKVGLGAIGALTGLEAPKTPDFNYSTAAKTTGLIGSSVSDAVKGFGVIGQKVKGALKGVGFTEPSKPLGAVNSGAVAVQQPPLDSSPVGLSKPNNGAIKDEESFNWPIAPDASISGSGRSGGPTTPGLGALSQADYRTREDIAPAIASSGYNPNDAKLADLVNDLLKTSTTGDPSVGRATKINALKTALQTLAPMTSYGQFGVAGIQADTARRGQEINAGVTTRGQDVVAETAKRAQDINAKIHADGTLLDTFYKTGLLEQGKEELSIKKLQAEAKDLPGYLKMVAAISPKIKNTDPVTGEETESHDVAKGVELLTQAGFATPKGFKAPGASKVPSFDEVRAVAKAKGTKMSDEQLTQYYNEKYGKGR
jgi:hypothetical protein